MTPLYSRPAIQSALAFNLGRYKVFHSNRNKDVHHPQAQEFQFHILGIDKRHQLENGRSQTECSHP